MKSEEKTKKNIYIDWIFLILLGLTSPFFLFPSMKYVWIFLIIPIIWILRWCMKKHFFERTLLDWAIIVLCIQVFATCIIIPDISFSLPKIAGALFGLAFFYSLTSLLTSEKIIKWAILSYLAAGLFFSFVCITGMKWDWELYFVNIISEIKDVIPRMKWSLPGAEDGFNPNAVGGTLILILPLCLVFFFIYSKRKKGDYLFPSSLLLLIFLSAILFIISILLFFTLSMGSWIGLFLSSWILLFSWKWKKWSLPVILIFVILIFVLSPAKMTKYSEIIKEDIVIRESFWLSGLNIIKQYSLFGIGMNQFRQLPGIGYEKAHAHNHLIHTAAEIGIPGLIAYLAILIGTGFMCFEVYRKSKKGWMKAAALGLGCGQLAHLFFGMVDSIPLGAKVGIFFWFSLALITSIYNFMLKNGENLKLDD